jgi:hypothetical protein
MRRYVAATIVAVLVVGLALAVLGCGGGVAGTYKAESDDPEFQDVELVMNDDGTFKVSGEITGQAGKISIDGTYELDGDSISLTAKGLNETEKGSVGDGKLVFEEVTWVKQ